MSEQGSGERRPRIALALGADSQPLDLSDADAQEAVDRYPEIRRDWAKWNTRFPEGRLIIIDPDWIARLKNEIISRQQAEPQE